jgi:hypothetical protein
MSGRKWTPEQRARFGEQIKAHWARPEYRERIAGRARTPEHRARAGAQLKAYWSALTPEKRAAVRASARANRKPIPPKIDPAVALKLHLEGKCLRDICDLFPGASRMAASRAIRRAKARGIPPAGA